MLRRGPVRRFPLRLFFGVAVVSFLPVPLQAQHAETDSRVITVTTFHVPVGEKLGKVLGYLDKYSVPAARENPHVLGYRYATHSWGDAAVNVWIIHEYASLAAVEAGQQWGADWFEEHFPRGTFERAEADRTFEEDYAPYLSKHRDEILTVDMNRAK